MNDQLINNYNNVKTIKLNIKIQKIRENKFPFFSIYKL